MHHLPSALRRSTASRYFGSRLADHLAVVIGVKIVALTLLWFFFFRPAS